MCVPKTKPVRMAATVKYHPHKIRIPEATKSGDTSLTAARLVDTQKSTKRKPNKTDEALQNPPYLSLTVLKHASTNPTLLYLTCEFIGKNQS